MHNICDGVGENWRGALVKRSPEKEWVRIRSAILRVLETVLQALVELRAVDEGEGR